MPLSRVLRMRRGEMKTISRRFLALSIGMALLTALPGPAAAHAILLDSAPALGSRVKAGKVAFHLRYNSLIDQRRSRLTLTLPDKTTKVLPIAQNDAQDVLISQAELAPGAYSLRWQVLAVDGHITRGDIGFTVEGN
jgi:copper resistance protein C